MYVTIRYIVLNNVNLNIYNDHESKSLFGLLTNRPDRVRTSSLSLGTSGPTVVDFLEDSSSGCSLFLRESFLWSSLLVSCWTFVPSSRRWSRWMALFLTPAFVLRVTVRIKPSIPMCTSSIMPIGHFPRGMLSSDMRTTSPIFNGAFSKYHFALGDNFGKYSWSHLFQKWLDIRCWYRYREETDTSVALEWWKSGKLCKVRQIHNKAGVITTPSLMSSPTNDSGLELIILDVSQNCIQLCVS